MRVIVVGGGWAGIATAMELCAHGADVTLIEAAAHLGGRARAVERHGLRFDNGQHLLIGAYRETLRLLDMAGVAEDRLFMRRPLHWMMRSTARPPLHIRTPTWLPAPLHMLWALLNARGYVWQERIAALRACAAVLRPVGRDLSVSAWLQQARQPEHVIETLWAPLCLAALNTPIEYASAEIYTRVLRDAFLQRRADADMLVPRCDLSTAFPAPAANFISTRGGRIHLSERVTSLIATRTRIAGVRSRRGDHIGDHVVLALPPSASAVLLHAHPALAALQTRLDAFEYEPICTAYLRYSSSLHFDAPMIGLLGGHAQWLFPIRHCGDGWVAAVISGPGEHMRIDNQALLDRLSEEIAAHCGTAARYEEGFVIREKRATFSCKVGINEGRPAARTALEGLWLAGDYTATGYPATLEGAVRSGVVCAREIIDAE